MTKKLFSILKDLKLEYSFYFLMLFSVISSLLEILSISSVLPLAGIIIDPEIFLKNEYLANFLQHNYFDKILKENLNNNIAILLIFLIITIFTTKFLFQIFFEWYRANIIYNLDRKISSYLYNYYINLPFKFHVNTNTSKLHRNIQGDATSVSNIFRSLIIIFTDSLIILGLVSILLYIDWFITFATLLSLSLIHI